MFGKRNDRINDKMQIEFYFIYFTLYFSKRKVNKEVFSRPCDSTLASESSEAIRLKQNILDGLEHSATRSLPTIYNQA